MTCFSHRNHRDECHGTIKQNLWPTNLHLSSCVVIGSPNLLLGMFSYSGVNSDKLMNSLFVLVQVITPEEIIDPSVDEQSVMTYLSQFPKAKLKPGAPLKPKLNPKKARAYGPGTHTHTHTLCVVKNIFTKLLGDFLKTVLKRTSGCWLSNTRASVFVACSSPCVD